jgi:hypothetical protein
LVLDHFDALNLAVVPVCRWDRWLLRYKQKRLQFPRQKIAPAFTPLYHHFQLQSEKRGGLVLDQFDALNLAVVSVCRWDRWLLRYKQKRLQFPRAKNCASLFHPLYHHFQLQSQKRGGSVLDQFDALNLAVVSVCQWDRWLLRYKPKQKIARHKNVAQTWLNLHPSVQHHQPTIRTPWRVGTRPT